MSYRWKVMIQIVRIAQLQKWGTTEKILFNLFFIIVLANLVLIVIIAAK